MPTDPPAPLRRRGRWRRIAVVCTLLTVILLAVVYAARGPLLSRPLADLIARQASRALGCPCRVGGVHGDLVHRIIIDDIRTTLPTAAAAAPLTSLSVRRVTLEFSLLDVVRGRVASAVRSLSIDGLDLELDLTRSAPATHPRPSTGAPTFSFSTMPSLHLRGSVRVVVPLPGPGVRVGHASIHQLSLDGDGSGLTVVTGGLACPELGIAQAAWSCHLTPSSTQQLIVSADGPLAGVMLHTLTISPASTSRPSSRQPRYEAEIGIAGGRVTMTQDGTFLGVRLAQLDTAQLPPWLAQVFTLPVSGIFNGNLSAQEPSAVTAAPGSRSANVPGASASTSPTQVAVTAWAGHADVAVHALTWHGLTASDATLSADLKDRILTITTLDLQGQWLHVLMHGLSVDIANGGLQALPVQCDLSTHDLGALLSPIIARPWPGPPGLAAELSLAGHQRIVDHFQIDLSLPGAHAGVSGTAQVPAQPDWRAITLDCNWHLSLSAGPATSVLQDALQRWLPAIHAAWAVATTVQADGDVHHSAGAMVAGGSGELTSDGHLEGSLGHPQGRVRVQATGQPSTSDALMLDAELAWPRLSVKLGELGFKGGHGSLSGDVDLETGAINGVTGACRRLALAPLAVLLPGTPAVHGTLSGDLEIQHWQWGSLSQLLARNQAKLNIQVTGLAFGPRRIGDLDLVLKLTAGDLVVQHARLKGPIQADVQVTMHAPARGGMIVDCTALTVSVPAVPQLSLHLRQPAHLSWTPVIGVAQDHRSAVQIAPPLVPVIPSPGPSLGSWQVDGLSLDVLGGRLDIDGHIDGDAVRLTARCLRLHPWVLLPSGSPPIEGTMDCSLAVSGNLHRPQVALHLTTQALRIAGRGAFAEVALHQDEQGLRLDACDMHIAGLVQVVGGGSWPMLIGSDGVHRLPGAPRLDVDLHVALDPTLMPARPGWPITGIANAALHLDARGAQVDLIVRDLVVRLPVPEEGVASPPDAIVSMDVHAATNPHGWTATLTAQDTAGLSVTAHASGAANIDSSRLWAAPQALLGDQMVARCVLTRLQLERLQFVLPQLVSLAGDVAGEVELSGPLRSPRWSGVLELNRISLKARADVPAITDGQGRMRLAGKRITVEKLAARMGYAPVLIDGWVDLAGPEPVVDVGLSGVNALVVRNQYLRLRVDADLHLRGALSAMRLAGTVTVTDALFSRSFELLSHLRPSGSRQSAPASNDGIKLFSIRQGPLAMMTFDVGVRAAATVHVRTNLFAGNCSLDLHLYGNGLSPSPNGHAWVDDAKVSLPFSSLQVTHAEVVFANNNPYQPTLQANGETRLKGYDLSVHVAGTLPDVVVTVDSDPPLSTNDGILLLTTGLTSQDRSQQGAGRSELAMMGKYLAKEIYGQVAEPGDPDAKPGLFDLDRLDLSVGQELSITGQNTIEAEYELTPRYYLRGERDLFDQYNVMVVWRIRSR